MHTLNIKGLMCGEIQNVYFFYSFAVGQVNCCWASTAPSSLVPVPAGPMTIFLCREITSVLLLVI
jgi:hypothetical protein